MSTFKFTKMHGLGNDFVVIDGVNQTISLGPAEIRSLCDRRLGVGCDQVLIVSPATRGGRHARWGFYVYHF
jgi:diaminopimelate epimerase